MTSTRRAIGFGAVSAAVLLSAAVLAQGPSQSRPQSQQPSTAQAEPKMSMDDMMKGCREHCQATTKSIDQLTEKWTRKASNDPAKMRAAGADSVSDGDRRGFYRLNGGDCHAIHRHY